MSSVTEAGSGQIQNAYNNKSVLAASIGLSTEEVEAALAAMHILASWASAAIEAARNGQPEPLRRNPLIKFKDFIAETYKNVQKRALPFKNRVPHATVKQNLALWNALGLGQEAAYTLHRLSYGLGERTAKAEAVRPIFLSLIASATEYTRPPIISEKSEIPEYVVPGDSQRGTEIRSMESISLDVTDFRADNIPPINRMIAKKPRSSKVLQQRSQKP